MNTNYNLLVAAFGAALILSAGSARSAALVDPSFFGQPNTTYQQWDGFTSPAGPNPPTSVNNPNGTPNWFDTTAATDGAFAIGAPPAAHIYSFSGALNLQADIPAPTLTGPATTTLILQAEVLGAPLDQNFFGVSYAGLAGAPIPPSHITEVDQGSSGSGFGGGDFYYQVQWDGLPAASSYAVAYSPNDVSSSQLSARIDTLTVVPEPVSLGILATSAAALFLHRRRGDKA